MEIIKKIKDNLLGLSTVLTIIFLLDIIFRPPLNIERFVFQHIPLVETKSKQISLPSLPKLEPYLKAVTERRIFGLRSKQPEEPLIPLTTNIQDYEFRGVVTLDKMYVAIFKKSSQEQFLVAEGGKVDGIKVKKIERGFVIIELYGEDRRIIF